MNLADFDFELPEELIAQEPPPERGGSRLLKLSRTDGALEDATFADLDHYVRPGDLLVLNNTRVFPARLIGRRDPSGGGVECLLIRQLPTSHSQLPIEQGTARESRELGVGSSEEWQALMHPGQKLKPGARVVFEGAGVTLRGEVLDRHFFGQRTVRLWTDGEVDVQTAIERLGHMPLPPYIKRGDRLTDRERYQTVYARDRGSVAAPTAGLHFTDAMLKALRTRGVEIAEITLHVGYGTFKPVRADRIEDHVVDAEAITVGTGATAALTAALHAGRRVVAVGTTTTRALESLTIEDGRVLPAAGQTNLFITPGHEFRIVSGMITNFHLPRSSLLMLVAAFAGRENVLAAYRHAIAARYRFYSYGDAMLIV
ncbi:MAG: tRNA preQ1(34) S-adenosylmethionine ribosyltransferase-isomerase QueA [Vicinamibacterales bacterium]